MVDPPRKAMENHGFDPLTLVIFSMIFPVATQDRTDFLPDRLAPLCCAAEGKKADVEIWIMRVPQMGVSENSVPLHPMVNDHYPY